MSDNQKILWGEGMLLSPQHFQQWDRYHAANLQRRFNTLQSFSWGISDLEFDADALLGGELAVRRCAGVMPDGFLFDAPGRDALPPPRNFLQSADGKKGAFDPKQNRMAVYLALPITRPGGVSCDLSVSDGAAPTTYRSRVETIADETRGNAERELSVALANLRLLFEGESRDDFQTIKVAEVIGKASGGHEFDRTFVPPCQLLSVSVSLQQILRRTIEMLSGKSADLAGQQRKSGGMAEAASFWLLHTVNSHLPSLLHFFKKERVHPEALYLALAGLAGELCTFAGHTHPRDLPVYDHLDLRKTFGGLDEKIRHLLDKVAPTRCIPIALERIGESLFIASIPDDDLLKAAQLYLAVLTDLPEQETVAAIPAKTKVSSRDRVQQLIMMATRGLTLRHVPTPPPDIPLQPGRSYFQLEKVGEHWDAICQAHIAAFHIPPTFPGLKLEFMAVKA